MKVSPKFTLSKFTLPSSLSPSSLSPHFILLASQQNHLSKLKLNISANSANSTSQQTQHLSKLNISANSTSQQKHDLHEHDIHRLNGETAPCGHETISIANRFASMVSHDCKRPAHDPGPQPHMQ
jgi:hypothetical protein